MVGEIHFQSSTDPSGTMSSHDDRVYITLVLLGMRN